MNSYKVRLQLTGYIDVDIKAKDNNEAQRIATELEEDFTADDFVWMSPDPSGTLEGIINEDDDAIIIDDFWIQSSEVHEQDLIDNE